MAKIRGRKVKKDYRLLTKGVSWTIDDQGIDNQTLQTSALLRIADATEMMAQNYAAIIKGRQQAENDRDKFYKWYQEERAKVQRLERRLSAQKGATTRTKNKLVKNNEQ